MDFDWSPEQTALRRAARDFAEKELAADAFAPIRPPDFVRDRARRLAQLGFTGLTFPTSDGGQGGTVMDAVIVLAEVARVCPHTGDVVQAYNFGPICQLQHAASPDLKDRWLKPALEGDVLISLAMSEPDAGSSLSAMRATAAVSDDSVIINGSKLFATHGVDADLILAWCKFGSDPRSIGVVAVPATTPGFSRGKAETFMSGERFCEMHFEDCVVPRENVLVDHNAVRELFPLFNVERIGNATRAIALASAAFDMALEHAAIRKIGDSLLKDLQGIQWKFADMRLRLDAAKLLIYRAAASACGPSDLDTALAKCFANEAAFFVADQSLQVFGASGYTANSPVDYIFRRVRGWMIAGGTTEVLRNRIASAVFRKDGSTW
jgi:alkylation response protein AidB-like acyl-CoA dehydrogenase